MSRKPSLEPLDYAFGFAAAAGGALAVAVLLGTLSTPKDFTPRIDGVRQQTERTETLLRPVRDLGPYGGEALCTRQADEQARVLHELVSAQTAQAGLALNSLDARAEPSPEVSERVTPVRLRFSVTGSYEGAVGLLALLSRERPQLFVDSLDMTPKVSNVALSLSGRVFCGA